MIYYDGLGTFMNNINRSTNLINDFNGKLLSCGCGIAVIQIKEDIFSIKINCLKTSTLSAPTMNDLIIKTTIRDNVLVSHMVDNVLYALKRQQPNNDYIAEVHIVPKDDIPLLQKEEI